MKGTQRAPTPPSNTPAPNRMLKLAYLFMLVNVLFKQAAAEATDNRIIRHAHGVDPLAAFSADQVAAAVPRIILDGLQFDLTSAIITDQMKRLVNGTVYDDSTLKVPVDSDIIIIDDPVSFAPSSSPQECIAELPAGIPQCNADIGNDVRVAIIDTVFKKTDLLHHEVTSLGSFVGPDVCLSHGGYVASVIDEMIPKGNMQFNSVGVFDCGGTGSSSNVIAAVNLVIKAADENPTIKYVINFSGSGGSHQPTDDAFIEAENRGIGVYVSAGNNAQDCRFNSPARAAATSSVSSTGASCGQVPCFFTNYELDSAFPAGQCVTLNLPGCVPVVNPLNGIRSTICGTSFSSPIAAGRHAIAAGLNPDRSVEEIKQLLTEGVIKVDVPTGARFSGKWDVLDKLFECPGISNTRQLFDGTLVLNKNDSNTFKVWYRGDEIPGSFCVKFLANTHHGALVVNTRTANDFDATTKVEIGMHRKHALQWLHRIKETIPPEAEKIVARNVTRDRVIGGAFKEFTMKANGSNFLVQYQNDQGKQVTLLSAATANKPADVAFSTYGGDVSVKNATRCVV